MTTVSVFIDGVPKPKGRPRFRVFNGRVMTYTPKDTAMYESFIGEFIRARYPDLKPHDGPLTLDIRFYMPIPKSAANKFRYHTRQCKYLSPDDYDFGPAAVLPPELYVPCPHCKPEGIAYFKVNLPTSKPDLDNLEKAISDGIVKSGIIKDDCQVVNKTSSKRYSRTPGVKVTLTFGASL